MGSGVPGGFEVIAGWASFFGIGMDDTRQQLVGIMKGDQPTLLQADGAEWAKISAALEQTGTDLENAKNALQPPVWDGEAAKAFTRRWSALNRSLTPLVPLASKLATTLPPAAEAIGKIKDSVTTRTTLTEAILNALELASGGLRVLPTTLVVGAQVVTRYRTDTALDWLALESSLSGLADQIYASGGPRQAATRAAQVPGGWPPPAVTGQDLDHVTKGTFNADGVPVGWHHRQDGVDPPGRRPGVLVTPPDADGVYTARGLEFERPDGTWAVKKYDTTFFPDSWSEPQVKAAVQEAWNDPSGTRNSSGRAWTGQGGGIQISGYYDPTTGEFRTAFPS